MNLMWYAYSLFICMGFNGFNVNREIDLLCACFCLKVRSVLEMLQGFSSSFFYWDYQMKVFLVKSGIYLRHLSQSSLHAILNQFMHAATCLQLVEIVINKAEKSVKVPPPTLRAFASSASAWLKVCMVISNLMKFCYRFSFNHVFLITCFWSRGCVKLLWRNIGR